jgi:hypothetical protein
VAGGAPVESQIALLHLYFQTRRLSRSFAHGSALARSRCQSSVAETLFAGPPPGSTVSRLLATSVAASRSSSVVTQICHAQSPANDGGSVSPRQPPEEWRSWLDTRAKGAVVAAAGGQQGLPAGGSGWKTATSGAGRRATSSRYNLLLLLETKPTRMALVGNFRWN